MVSSSLDKNIKKALGKDSTATTAGSVTTSPGESGTLNNSSSVYNSGGSNNFKKETFLPAEEKIQLLFPKCKPRSDHHGLNNTTSTQDTFTTDLISIASSSSTSSQSKLSLNTIIQQHSTQVNNNCNNNNNNKQMKLQSPLSPDHKNKIQHHLQYLNNNTSNSNSEQAKLSKIITSNKHEQNNSDNNYIETNPFRIGSNNRYFYAQPTQNDLLLFNNNNNSAIPSAANTASSLAAAQTSSAAMHHYNHYTNASTSGYYQSSSHDRHNYFLEPDEIEHNPYILDTHTSSTTNVSNSLANTIPSSVLKTTPPDTPPALQPCTTTPVDLSPLGSNRNLWDLSPIKSTTPTRIKTQSPSPTIYSRPHRGSYKKLLASPVPIEEDLEMGHYYYNNKKPYYQAPQTDSDSANEPATFNDIHETEKIKPKASYFSKSKVKHSESSDVIYAEIRKDRGIKEERKMIKSKSGSGIMEYDGSPRRFGMASNDDVDYYTINQSNYKYVAPLNSPPPPPPPQSSANGSLINYASSSPPRPGFPQRILSHCYDQSQAAPLPKSYSFDDQQSLISAAYAASQQNVTTTSKLIPTTFINNSVSPYELLSPQEKTQATIVEDENEIVVDSQDDDEIERNVVTVMPEESSIIQNNSIVTAIEEEEEMPQLQNEISSTKTQSCAFDITSPTDNLPTSTFDYLYEFSETRKVLEEFFKCPDDKIKEFEKFSDFNESDDSLDIQYDYRGQIEKEMESLYGSGSSGDKQATATSSSPTIKQQLEEDIDDDNRDDKEDDKEEEAYVKAKQNGFMQQQVNEFKENNKSSYDYYNDTASRSSIGDDNMDQENELDNLNNSRNLRRMSRSTSNNNNNNNNVTTISANLSNSNGTSHALITNNNGNSTSTSYQRRQSKNFNYSPDTTDYDSESSMRYISSEFPSIPVINNAAAAATVEMSGGPITNNYYPRYCTSMPVLEDGLSSGHASDNENNNNNNSSSSNLTSNNSKRTNNNNNNSSIASSISTIQIQKQYQENLVQTHANNNIFYNNNNNNNNGSSVTSTINAATTASTKQGGITTLNGTSNNVLNNGDIHDTKVRSAQSPPNYHPYYAMRYDSQSLKDSAMRYDNKDILTRYDSNNSKETLMNSSHNSLMNSNKIFKNRDPDLESLYTINTIQLTPPPPAPVAHRQIINDNAQFATLQSQQQQQSKQESEIQAALKDIRTSLQRSKVMNASNSPSQPLFNTTNNNNNVSNLINSNSYYDRTPVIPEVQKVVESPAISLSPVWIPRSREKNAHSPIANESGSLLSKHHKNSDDEDEEEIDTDLETDRLLGHQMLDDGFYDDKTWNEARKLQQHRTLGNTKISPKVNQNVSSTSSVSNTVIPKSNSSTLLRHGLNTLLPTSNSSDCCLNNSSSPVSLTPSLQPPHPKSSTSSSLKTSPAMLNSNNMLNCNYPKSATSPDHPSPSSRKLDDLPEQLEEQQAQSNGKSSSGNVPETTDLCNLDEELVDSPGGSSSDKSKKDTAGDKKKKNKNKEVLIEGVLFRARYLGSTQLVCEGQPTKSTRMMQAEEAVSRIKALAPDGENQPSTEVDLFISTEKIMVLNTDLKEIMMDHALRTISYIADIGDLVVLMARRRFMPQDHEANSDSGTGTGGSGNVSGGSGGPTPPTSGKINRTPKMICHVFESEEAQFIAQSIGQAFQVAYMEFLKANGIEDHSFMKEMDYQEVLNSQEIFGDELEIFAKKELQKEVVVPKAKGEILGVVIVESGWGSMLPTVVIANLASNGAAARCGQLNIGDQIIAINGLSLVGLPLSQCQQYIKNTKNQTVVKFTVVPCAPVVEVKIKRPNTKYQLGFSVQNGVICSLLRGGIAERGGVRVGHRIIEINGSSVVAVPHEKIVNLLATSVGEILMKTMPTSMFRLLTGQENPIYI
ncbi:hypothetical protein PVAND_010628 [Polypedilum vanderplanki]|uniref:Protein lin-10 n=1 Tax=Polypedilum vanderplanki TaxID=319348 RepID=A0A9J6CG61_POLVA|nr:hypothetical protein PVAND_010628 [Polypedilum vanderplanki]